jgi:hypothetical protein
MKIYNLNGIQISGCATMEYRGYELSISTISRPQEILIFKGDKDVTEELSGHRQLMLTLNELVQIKELIDKVESESAEA